MKSDHKIVEAFVYTARDFKLNFPDRLADSSQHRALIGIAMALDHHALQAKEAGTIVA